MPVRLEEIWELDQCTGCPDIRKLQVTFMNPVTKIEPETRRANPCHKKSCINTSFLRMCREWWGDLAGRHSLGDNSLQCELFLLQVIRCWVLNLKLSHGIAESGLDLVLCSALKLEGHGWVRNNFFHSWDICLKLLSRLELLAESLVGGLEFLGV